MIIDTHCHLDFPQFDEDREEVIMRAKKNGVTQMITIGCNVMAAPKAIEIAQNHEGIFAAIGIHPCDITKNFSEEYKIISSLSVAQEVVAIGETGLDFFRPENPKKNMQFDAFHKHVDLAQSLKKPVIVHLRDAEKEAEEFFSERHDFLFVIHCFLGDWEFAKKILDWGGMLSFTGISTFKNASKDLIEVLEKVPADRIMVETDSPFLAPVPFRGKRCEPAFTKNTAEFLADARGENRETFFMQTTNNAKNFFGI